LIERVANWMRTSPLALPVLVFLLSLPAVTVRLFASDEIEYFAYLRSAWFDHDLSFDNEYRHFYDAGIGRGARFHEAFLETTTATGLRVNLAPVGTAIMWSPFYAVADVGVRTARMLGSQVPADGFSRPYIAAVTYGSAIYGFLAVLLSGWLATRMLGTGAKAAALVLVGTPLLFYMYVAPGFSHACSAFSVAAFVATWLRVRNTWSLGGVLALGALAALMGMVREQDVFIAIGPAIDYLQNSARAIVAGDDRVVPRAWRAAAGAATFGVCVLPQAMAYEILYGHLGPSPIVAQKMTWTAPYALKVLASPANGLLFWTPLALPALIGLGILTRGTLRTSAAPDDPLADPWVGVLCLVMVLTQIYVCGSFATWMGAGSFGQRRLVGLTVFFVIGLAALYRVVRPGWPQWSLSLAIALCVWWNLGLIVQFGSGLMDRQAMNPALNAYHNFVTIPRTLPKLAYRYVFDRESFYQTRMMSTP
jgi:hypothetical protein